MGPSAFSEPETQAIKAFIDTHTNITVLLSFHTFSELILYPWGGKVEPIAKENDHKVFETMAKKMATWNGYTPEQASALYVASGDTTDWAYGVHGIFAFTFELDPKDMWSGGGFYPGAGVIDDVVKKNTEPVLYMLELADNPYRVLNQNMYSYQQ
jgi:carboxypeptidase T